MLTCLPGDHLATETLLHQTYVKACLLTGLSFSRVSFKVAYLDLKKEKKEEVLFYFFAFITNTF